MAGGAEEFWAWVRDNPPETIEQLVLQHVRVKTVEGKKSTLYTILDDGFAEILQVSVPQSVQKKPGYSPQKAITQALLAHVICVRCGTRLMTGELTVCSPCEATQVMDLLRISRELQD